MTEHQPRTIRVSVAKSHLVTLGEQLYTESIALVRELVNNAYDADATDVYVTVGPEQIVVEDNGSGMDERGLTQFFTVGSEEKRAHSLSPGFGRKRIGQFGIGKFAALAVAKRFTVETRKKTWVYTVTFDRDQWAHGESWELPITREPATPLHHEGTKVTLAELTKLFSVKDVERYLKESVPLHAKKFAVYVNQHRITARYIPGRHIPMTVQTLYGSIEGECVIAVHPRYIDAPGVECRVKGVLIRRETFGLEEKFAGLIRRVTGAVNADWLPITASRTEFVRDTPEFRLFAQCVHAALENVLKTIEKESAKKEATKFTEQLRDVLEHVRAALTQHPELMPSGRAIAARRKRQGDAVASTLTEEEQRALRSASESGGAVAQQTEKSEDDHAHAAHTRTPQKTQVVPQVIPKPAIVKQIRLPRLGVSVGITSLGHDGPEVCAVGNMIYVNQDHPLFRHCASKKELLSFHFYRLVTQELVLMKKMRLSAPDAYAMQSALLTEALAPTTTLRRHDSKKAGVLPENVQ